MIKTHTKLAFMGCLVCFLVEVMVSYKCDLHLLSGEAVTKILKQ